MNISRYLLFNEYIPLFALCPSLLTRFLLPTTTTAPIPRTLPYMDHDHGCRCVTQDDVRGQGPRDSALKGEIRDIVREAGACRDDIHSDQPACRDITTSLHIGLGPVYRAISSTYGAQTYKITSEPAGIDKMLPG